MNSGTALSRRDFLKGLGAGGVALVLGFRMSLPGEALAEGLLFEPNANIVIDASGGVKLWIPWQEIGQGSLTAISMLLAEELEADWDSIEMQMAPALRKFGRMTTGGSRSVRESWEPLRKAGARAREMLISAAAAKWQVDTSECRARSGKVLHKSSGRVLGYGELVEDASKLDEPRSPQLKSSDEFRIIGQSIPRVDSPDKVDGKTIYGFDLKHENMLTATLLGPPDLGGKLISFDDSDARAIDGVQDVMELEGDIAVLADDTWAALRGREALKAEWEPGEGSSFDSEVFRVEIRDLTLNPGTEARHDGDAPSALLSAASTVEALYELPFLSHAPMETMNTTASYTEGSLNVEVPTQGPSWCRSMAERAARLHSSKIHLRPMLAGGGFGRRLWPDYVDAPVRLTRKLKRPVKVIWSREDEFAWDYFRPASAHRMRAGLDENGKLVAWAHTLASPSISGMMNPAAVVSGLDEGVLAGAENLPYAIDNLLVDLHLPPCDLPVGWLRSVYDQNNAFANECFVDEIAIAMNRDPVELRLELLADNARLRGVVERVAEVALWAKESSLARGMSCHHCFGTSVAMIAEVSGDKRPKVHRIFAAVDCGPVVHPDSLRQQMEGGIAYALSAALYENVVVSEGRVQKLNFDEYRVLRMDEMPEVVVHTVDSGSEIGGIGEPPVPPTAAAVCNAWFAATEQRVRKLPILS
jgi:isoquinoline 1-oxidoreductase beta subunit